MYNEERNVELAWIRVTVRFFQLFFFGLVNDMIFLEVISYYL